MRKERTKYFLFILIIFYSVNTYSQLIVKEGNFSLKLKGEYRLIIERISSMDINVLDNNYPDILHSEGFGEQRLRFGGAAFLEPRTGAIKKGGFDLEFDLLDNLLWTNATKRDHLQYSKNNRIEENPFSFESAKLNKLYAFIVIPPLILKAGRQKSHFGLGILANDGEEEKDRISFGYKIFGDIVERGQITFLPLVFTGVENKQALTISFIADKVVRDVLADKEDRDDAYQLLGVINGESENLKGGLYYVYRKQKNYLSDETRINVMDAYLKFKIPFKSNAFFINSEFVFASGETAVSRNINFPEGEKVSSKGFVIDGGFENKLFKISIEGGFAAGDNNPYDGVFKTFNFNPDYNVGLIMFEEYIKVHSAISAYNASLPQYQMEPPRGFNEIPTNGSVSNALYFNPKILFTPISNAGIIVGFLKAISDEYYADPFLSAINGGTPEGPRGAKNKKDLGWEVDLSLFYELLYEPLKIRGVFDFGYFKPGDVFDNTAGESANPVIMVRGRIHILL